MSFEKMEPVKKVTAIEQEASNVVNVVEKETNEFGPANLIENPDGVLRLIAEIEASGTEFDGKPFSKEKKQMLIEMFMDDDKSDLGENSVTGQIEIINKLNEEGKSEEYTGGIIYGIDGVDRYKIESGLFGGKKGDIYLIHDPDADLSVKKSRRDRAGQLGVKIISSNN